MTDARVEPVHGYEFSLGCNKAKRLKPRNGVVCAHEASGRRCVGCGAPPSHMVGAFQSLPTSLPNESDGGRESGDAIAAMTWHKQRLSKSPAKWWALRSARC